MFGPGAYRPDPTEGITAIADLPPPENACAWRLARCAYRFGPSLGGQ